MDRVNFAQGDGLMFAKGHGTGNDFVILPDPDGQLPLTPTLVAALCDRRQGIGADGVLRVVRSAKHPDSAGYAAQAEWFMDYWNADGSIAEMCGNGVRVFTRFLVEAGLLGEAGAAAVDPTGAGAAGAGTPRTVAVATRAGVIRVLVGERAIAAGLRLPALLTTSTAVVRGVTLPGVAVDCGNPHLVCTGLAATDLSTLDLTGQPGFDPEVFPSGVNVEFVTALPAPGPGGSDLHVRMRVHERGSAETMSCGSGACAVAAVALNHAGLETGAVTVDVPGGRLTVTLDGQACWLAGPAVIVAYGEVDLTAVAPAAG